MVLYFAHKKNGTIAIEGEHPVTQFLGIIQKYMYSWKSGLLPMSLNI